MKVTKDIFPQFIEDAASSSASFKKNDVLDKSMESFYSGNNIPFIKAGALKSYKKDKNRISLIITGEKYVNKLVMTHETVMNQLSKDKEEVRDFEIEACIEIWSENIFRVRYGMAPLNLAKAEYLPVEQRMLIGKMDMDLLTDITENDEHIVISTNEMSIKIDKKDSVISVYDKHGKYITKQARYCIFPTDAIGMSLGFDNNDIGVFEAYELSSKEQIYGLGERFDHVARKGIQTDFWNKDAIGTSNTRTYINAPFIVSTSKYGIFLNSSSKTQWDIATKEASTLSFSTLDAKMDYFLITGDSMQHVIYNYSKLTGLSPVPPIWSFGLWMSRNSYLSWDIVFEVAENLRKNNFPCDVMHLDTAWFEKDWNCDLRFSKERFPNPKENIKRLNDMGFKVSVWQYNFIPPNEDNVNYVEARKKGYLALDKDNNIFAHNCDIPGSWKRDAVIDFSNPEACKWYAAQIKNLIEMGVSSIKTDFGEGIPEDAVYANIPGEKFHNLYSLVYNQVIFDATKQASGADIVWARSGTSGGQRYPLHWGGDSQSSFEGLKGTIRGGLSLGLSGFIFYSHDIGGFIGRPTPELYIRWAQAGLFSSHSRCHGGGNTNSREPWAFGEQAGQIFKKFVNLRYSLLPYIITEANYCAKHAVPMMRAMVLEADEDINTYNIDDQYMFGRYLLVAPVMEPLEKYNTRQVYLPKGVWYDYWTKEKLISQGEWIRIDISIETLPLYVKQGAILVYGKDDKQSTEDTIFPIIKIESYGGKNSSYLITDGKLEEKIEVKDGMLITNNKQDIEFSLFI